MTYGPNATHFTGQMPTFLKKRAIAELINEPGPVDEIDDYVSEQPKSRWQTVRELARDHWPS
jgi:hypothetical protein